jgi:hypothetical protein
MSGKSNARRLGRVTEQAALRALLYRNGTLPAGDPKHEASFDALVVIPGEEFHEVFARMPLEAAVERLADRLKSNQSAGRPRLRAGARPDGQWPAESQSGSMRPARRSPP